MVLETKAQNCNLFSNNNDNVPICIAILFQTNTSWNVCFSWLKTIWICWHMVRIIKIIHAISNTKDSGYSRLYMNAWVLYTRLANISIPLFRLNYNTMSHQPVFKKQSSVYICLTYSELYWKHTSWYLCLPLWLDNISNIHTALLLITPRGTLSYFKISD